MNCIDPQILEEEEGYDFLKGETKYMNRHINDIDLWMSVNIPRRKMVKTSVTPCNPETKEGMSKHRYS
ncbi:hypothetical protein C922_05178 [Plasmodium inui San Antonio 1]|uniref:Uncharacterized protein n=1 Tax=Plasmodium inui San Antonio 1 TaxID=1237626 RepID=W7A5R9_9APIC|nr:hypothetical protein C922_05178 [Plasmodium inui San Antonio 1]EUD64434.1 hypothetical protein C922_05178 [Plasmodium inui San Antonio 1]